LHKRTNLFHFEKWLKYFNTKDRRFITQITCYEKGKEGKQRKGMNMPLFGKQGGGVLSSLFSKIGRQGTK
jgi:hypothetical protein